MSWSQPDYYDEVLDEGIAVLQHALDYLDAAPEAEDEEAVQDAMGVLEGCISDINHEFQCHFCGYAISKRQDKYCSKGCYTADMEGL